MTLLSRRAALLVITPTGGKKILNLYCLNFSSKVPLTIGNLCPLDFKKWLKPTSLIQTCMKFLWRFFWFIFKIHIHFSFYSLLHFCFLWGKNKISLKYFSKIEAPGIRATLTLRLLEPASTLYLSSCPSLPLTAQDPSSQQQVQGLQWITRNYNRLSIQTHSKKVIEKYNLILSSKCSCR